VPAFHALAFASKDRLRAVVNIGGIANVSMIPPRPIQASPLAETHPGTPLAPTAAPPIVGFDTGPGNLLMDTWCEQHLGQAYDAEGRWARGGVIIDSLLNQMLADRYFELAPPKSTGRDLFSPDWLAGHLSVSPPARPQDVQATLAELTARSIALACLERGAEVCRVCGGGAQNTYLMDRLAALMPGIEVTSTAALGVDPGAVEALAFAWLARERLAARPANLPSVTGARGLRVLGAVYPASSGA
jgi:anhydro-N-acetylmuramic acid kinase